MGLFTKAKPPADGALTPQEGFAGIALLAVAADGQVTEDEVSGLVAQLARMRLYDGLSPRQMNALLQGLVPKARAHGFEGFLGKAAEALPADLRPTAFAVACDLVLADGAIQGAEKTLLIRLQGALAVDEATADLVVKAIQIKNRG